MAIRLKELNHRRFCDWVFMAGDKKESDTVFAFIAPSIAFNYYYGTFAASNGEKFKQWANANNNGSRGDKSQWLFLVSDSDFSAFFDNFRSTYSDVFGVTIRLPIINMLEPTKMVPSEVSGNTQLNSLTAMQIFEIIYQIRNNLFHGDKEPFIDGRDRVLTKMAINFLFPFLLELLRDTFGYEMDAFEISEAEEYVGGLLYPDRIL